MNTEYTDQLTLEDGSTCTIYSLKTLDKVTGSDISRFPYCLKIIMESLLRMQDHPAYQPEHIQQLAQWSPSTTSNNEYPYMPSRVLLQDFTGVPCVVDLAALRSALKAMGIDPRKIEPQIPVDLIIDHSVQTDEAGHPDSLSINMSKEFERNLERYRFLKWGQSTFKRLRVLPPGLGICHQINMEYLAGCVTLDRAGDTPIAYPDTLVGTDSHTVMINSMGVVGWGVGGIEAEAAMLGQPIPIVTPTVIGVKLTGQLQPGVTPTDAALSITKKLREYGVVGRFVEYFGPGLDGLTLAERAPIANMAPEYGATMGFFPIDEQTLRYLRETGRSEYQTDLVERYCKAQGLWFSSSSPDPFYTDVIPFDLSAVKGCIAGPKKPQERIELGNVKESFESALTASVDQGGFANREPPASAGRLSHGDTVIASITSCTNTSTPSMLIGAGLMAQKAVQLGLQVPDYVKTSFAPGSRVVTKYLDQLDLTAALNELGFNTVSYGCASCIGNSGPLEASIEQEIKDRNIVAAAVLSGNRNFEGRVHPLTQANYLCSPLLVLAYALAGTVRIDLTKDALGKDTEGRDVYLSDLWPGTDEIQALIGKANNPELYQKVYEHIQDVNPMWNELPSADAPVFAWDDDSTYIREPAFFENLPREAGKLEDIEKASVLGLFGDFITTDHISPAGAIPLDSPAADYLRENGVEKNDFNSFGSRRGNHEVMMRGTFGNIRIRNKLVNRVGGYTLGPDLEETSMYEAAVAHHQAGNSLIVLAGKMYGAGSSRDWAAKGTFLLGVKAVIAESFERIHRSNLVEMGVLPLEFTKGQNAESLGLTGKEQYTIKGIAEGLTPGQLLTVHVEGEKSQSFEVKARVDAPIEVDYYRHGGILQYVLRTIATDAS